MKTCKKCNTEKELTDFQYHPETADRKKGMCRKCINEVQRIDRFIRGNNYTKVYEKTPKGYLMRVYRNMKSRISGVQKNKFHLYRGKEILDKNEFYEWAINNEEFISLFNNYTDSGYKISIAPSIDRIDSCIGYVMGNIRFITQRENSQLGAISRNKKAA